MKKLILVVLLMTSPAWAQSKPVGGKRVDNCAPIGRTADGKLVYSMKCENLPVAVPAPAAADASPAPAEKGTAAEPESDQGGLFKFPFPSIIKPTNEQQRPAGVGPAQPR
jgi:hypothetical protein